MLGKKGPLYSRSDVTWVTKRTNNTNFLNNKRQLMTTELDLHLWCDVWSRRAAPGLVPTIPLIAHVSAPCQLCGARCRSSTASNRPVLSVIAASRAIPDGWIVRLLMWPYSVKCPHACRGKWWLSIAQTRIKLLGVQAVDKFKLYVTEMGAFINEKLGEIWITILKVASRNAFPDFRRAQFVGRVGGAPYIR